MKSSHNPPQGQQPREDGGAHGKFHGSGLQGEFHHGADADALRDLLQQVICWSHGMTSMARLTSTYICTKGF